MKNLAKSMTKSWDERTGSYFDKCLILRLSIKEYINIQKQLYTGIVILLLVFTYNCVPT